MSKKKIIHAQRISGLLSSSEHLSGLLKHAKNISKLNDKLRKYLKPPLSDHCSITNYSDEILTISVDTPAWGSRIHYASPEILRFIKSNCGLKDLHKIKIIISLNRKTTNIESYTTNAIKRKRIMLSKESARIIREAGGAIKNSELRKSILKISEHAK